MWCNLCFLGAGSTFRQIFLETYGIGIASWKNISRCSKQKKGGSWIDSTMWWPVINHSLNSTWWVFPKIMVPPNHHFNRVSHYKPSILGENPLFLETPWWFFQQFSSRCTRRSDVGSTTTPGWTGFINRLCGLLRIQLFNQRVRP